ncbi:hypothetical protein K437DRAFT_265837 [Tilletiaria anomala UBC 951]|uniref:Epidermal growth factor receptor-like transmembrane-juxtamembrane segment domain-containing protein n=1 Tax=Tilletiaria anomala (strain ATCC 24038 / CBS 436.72 / UBC 951) TaxID=1037660 RepID=A0A066WS23_TILAU|nr:uncharacterized protein K437DRAFT_265837 [Tilletiaria anomala UBC 951]KDN53480.1 hypothetical protein K437DRAFT_265837 [Tilletiaria anomala UBC 951]
MALIASLASVTTCVQLAPRATSALGSLPHNASSTALSSSSAKATASGSAAPAASSSASSGSPPSLCEIYTKLTLGSTTPDAQYEYVRLIVNSIFVGNFSNLAKGSQAPTGILTNNGRILSSSRYTAPVDLHKYFDGTLLSTNRNNKAVSVNFLDGGGRDPLFQNQPAVNNTSNQYFLMTHLYTYFGALLGCSAIGGGTFPQYSGSPSMGSVHKFMNIGPAEFLFFKEQTAYSLVSFGMDVNSTVEFLGLLENFDLRCRVPFSFPNGAPAESQVICSASDCGLAPNTQGLQDCTQPDVNGTHGVAPQRASYIGEGATGSPRSGSGANVGAIAGGIVGGVVGLALVALGIFLLMRRQRQKNVQWEHDADDHAASRYGKLAPTANAYGGAMVGSDAGSGNFTQTGLTAPRSILISQNSRPTSPDAFSSSARTGYYDHGMIRSNNGRPASVQSATSGTSRATGRRVGGPVSDQRSISDTLGSQRDAMPSGALLGNAPPMYERYVSAGAARMGDIDEQREDAHTYAASPPSLASPQYQPRQEWPTPAIEDHPGISHNELLEIARDVELPPGETERLIKEAHEARAAAFAARQQGESSGSSAVASASHTMPILDTKDEAGPSS